MNFREPDFSSLIEKKRTNFCAFFFVKGAFQKLFFFFFFFVSCKRENDDEGRCDHTNTYLKYSSSPSLESSDILRPVVKSIGLELKCSPSPSSLSGLPTCIILSWHWIYLWWRNWQICQYWEYVASFKKMACRPISRFSGQLNFGRNFELQVDEI